MEMWSLVFVVVVLVVLLGFALSRVKRCPDDKLLVVYGKGPGRCLHGGWTFVLPLIQDYRYMSLEPIEVSAPDSSQLPITVKISTETAEMMSNAMVHLLGLSTSEIQETVRSKIQECAEAQDLEVTGGERR